MIAIENKAYKKRKCVLTGYQNDICHCYDSYTSSEIKQPGDTYFIDLSEPTTYYVQAHHTGHINYDEEDGDVLYGIDFNGDGKTEIVHITENNLDIYTLNQYNTLNLFESVSIPFSRDTDFHILPADFNGDGKMDIAIPKTNYGTEWVFLFGGKTSFVIQDIGVMYAKSHHVNQFAIPGEYGYHVYDGWMQDNYLAQDFNGDGKADILHHAVVTGKYYNNINKKASADGISVYFNNYDNANNSLTFDKVGAYPSNGGWNKYTNLSIRGVPVFLEGKLTNNNLEYIYLGEEKLFPFEFGYDHQEEVLLREVKENNTVKTKFSYKALNSPGNTYTYWHDSNEEYPFVNINLAPSLRVVQKIEQSIEGSSSDTYREQHFRYKGAVSHVKGLGFLGFKTLWQTNLYGNNANLIWNVSKHDMQKRGAVTQQWSSTYFTSNPGSNYINKTDYTYALPDLDPNLPPEGGVFKLYLKKIDKYDKLKGISTSEEYTYDNYFNPTEVKNTFPGGSETKTYTYSNNPAAISNIYHVGRTTLEKIVTTLGNESFTTETNFTYNNNLVTQKKVKSQNSNWLYENFSYDNYGNIIQKSISGTGSDGIAVNRVEYFEFDSSGRFMSEQTDIAGLSTTYSYDDSTGDFLSETSPYGNTTSFTYDGWQRKLTETDYLGNQTKFYYNQGNTGEYLKIIDFPNGQDKKIYSNQYGWVTTSKQLSLNDKWIVKSNKYDPIGRKIAVSEPYFEGESASQWNHTHYDTYGRVISQELYTGKIINTSYNELSTTVDDGTKTVTTTTDAVGNVVELQDPGGTITYGFFANGIMKSANYGSFRITTTIDDWGRKKSLNDSSAGNYTYEYNILGEITKETTPKGSTTYSYNNEGNLTQKIIQGDATDLALTYQYNATTKLLETINGVDNITNGGEDYIYNYTYDTYKRIEKVEELTPFATFVKETTFDSYGRVENEKYNSATIPINGEVTIHNEYDSAGILTEIKDAPTNNSLWKINTENARQQPLSISLGNGYSKNRSYDAYGHLTTMSDRKFYSSGQLAYLNYALNLNYDFDAQTGNLNSRINKNFKDLNNDHWTENFIYDDQDRLTGIYGAVNNNYTYDNGGRMMNNSQIGDYVYDFNAQHTLAYPYNYKLRT